MLNGLSELLRGRDLVVGERDRHAPLRQLDRQGRGNRQPIFRHVDQKKIAGTFVCRWFGHARKNRRRGGLRGIAIERLRQPIDRRGELGDQPACYVGLCAHVIGQRDELGCETFERRSHGLG